MFKNKLIKLSALVLSLIVCLSLVACSGLAVGDQLVSVWGKSESEEKLTYSMSLSNSAVGTLELSVKRILSDSELTFKTIDSNGAFEDLPVTVKARSTLIKGTLSFDADSPYAGDSLEYSVLLNEALRPLYSYRRLIADAYNAAGADVDNFKKAQSFVYSMSYDYSASTVSTANFKLFKYLDADSTETAYSTGSLTSTSKYAYDNDQLIYLLRCTPYDSNSSMSFAYEVFNPLDKTVTALTSSASGAKDLTDIPYSAYNNATVSTTLVTVSLNQSITGTPISIYFNNESITVGEGDNAVLLQKVPLKIIQGKATYVLTDVSAPKRVVATTSASASPVPASPSAAA